MAAHPSNRRSTQEPTKPLQLQVLSDWKHTQGVCSIRVHGIWRATLSRLNVLNLVGFLRGEGPDGMTSGTVHRISAPPDLIEIRVEGSDDDLQLVVTHDLSEPLVKLDRPAITALEADLLAVVS